MPHRSAAAAPPTSTTRGPSAVARAVAAGLAGFAMILVAHLTANNRQASPCRRTKLCMRCFTRAAACHCLGPVIDPILGVCV